MSREKSSTRSRIITAAEELAREVGPGSLSLDAVAARAGVSKGGLLYHFPSKSHLLRALVEDFVSRLDARLVEEENSGRPNAVIRAYLTHFMEKYRTAPGPASGLLAALAENPGMLDPVRTYERTFFERIRANAVNPQLATVAFLTAHAIHSMELLNVKVLEKEEVQEVIDWLIDQLK
jgi:AcrR family transcriptional regulator